MLKYIHRIMDDFYCEEAISGHTKVDKIFENDRILAFYHTKPFWPVHIVVTTKKHLNSLLTLTKEDNELVLELLEVIKSIADSVNKKHGACRVLTNLGKYQDSKHIHFHISAGESLS